MNTTIINVKVGHETKLKAKEVAHQLGFTLSALITAYLTQLIKTKTVIFSTTSEEPTKYLLSMLKKSKLDKKRGAVSPPFTQADEVISWLNNQKKES